MCVAARVVPGQTQAIETQVRVDPPLVASQGIHGGLKSGLEQLKSEYWHGKLENLEFKNISDAGCHYDIVGIANVCEASILYGNWFES